MREDSPGHPALEGEGLGVRVPLLGEEKGREAEEGLLDTDYSCARGRGARRRSSRDRGFFSLGFIKWNLKGNTEPEGGFLITSL